MFRIAPLLIPAAKTPRSEGLPRSLEGLVYGSREDRDGNRVPKEKQRFFEKLVDQKRELGVSGATSQYAIFALNLGGFVGSLLDIAITKVLVGGV